MPKHVTEWLNAYLDGELPGSRLHQVETHLTECAACQAALESLRDLSGLLHRVPAPEFTPADRFATQVNLLLPHRPVTASRSRLLEVGWWLIPVGLLTAWVFVSTTLLVSDMVSAATNLGILDITSAIFVSGPSEAMYWSSTLGQFGFLPGGSLQWFEVTESYSRNVLPQIVWQVSIALLYLSWMAVWWARRTRRGYGQFLEG